MRDVELLTVADGVVVASGPDVNWTLLVDDDGVTLVDAGYPKYVELVLESLRRIGRRPEDVRAILLTHAHIDHIGGAGWFASRHGTPVLTSTVEAAHARREYLEQSSPADVVRNAWRPGVLPWSLRITRAGGLESGAVPGAAGFDSVATGADGRLDLPGAPIPVATPGHTSGHTGYHLPDVGAVITGDALITGHALTSVRGAQLLPPMFSHDRAGEERALGAFVGLDADVLIPGHGPATRGSVDDAVEWALARR